MTQLERFLEKKRQSKLAREGQNARDTQRIDAHANIVADRRDQEFMAQRQQQNQELEMVGQAMNGARQQGQMEGAEAAVGGLGMGSQTIEGMNQLNQVSQESLQEAAMPIVGQALQALQQGSDPREIDAQISQSIEPELQDTVRQMLGQEIQRMQEQGQQQQAQQPQSTANQSSEAVMQQTAQIG